MYRFDNKNKTFIKAKLKKLDRQTTIDNFIVAAYKTRRILFLSKNCAYYFIKKLKNRTLDMNFLRFRLAYIIALLIVLKLIFLIIIFQKPWY